jgi:hypothetical protein
MCLTMCLTDIRTLVMEPIVNILKPRTPATLNGKEARYINIDSLTVTEINRKVLYYRNANKAALIEAPTNAVLTPTIIANTKAGTEKTAGETAAEKTIAPLSAVAAPIGSSAASPAASPIAAVSTPIGSATVPMKPSATSGASAHPLTVFHSLGNQTHRGPKPLINF